MVKRIVLVVAVILGLITAMNQPAARATGTPICPENNL
jgi:hypothetical protein